MWNGAAVAGLALGGVSSAYMFLTQFMSGAGLPAFSAQLVSWILWAVKFGGCIWIMMFFMKKFASENPEADNKDTRRFGMAAAFLSAAVFAAVSFANVAFISADMYSEQMNMLMQQMAPMMDSNTLSQVDKTLENLPQITFFSNLIYCFIYGAVLSAILSGNIPNRDPFADYKPEEQ